MTNDETIAAHLADIYLAALDNDDLDFEPHDLLIDLTHYLPESIIEPLMLALEMCPVHYCDLMICADDDEQECRSHWDNT